MLNDEIVEPVAEVEEAWKSLERWRQQGRQGRKIPEEVWQALTRAAREIGVSKAARLFGVNFYSLRKRLERAQAAPQTPRRFLEIPTTGPEAKTLGDTATDSANRAPVPKFSGLENPSERRIGLVALESVPEPKITGPENPQNARDNARDDQGWSGPLPGPPLPPPENTQNARDDQGFCPLRIDVVRPSGIRLTLQVQAQETSAFDLCSFVHELWRGLE